MPDLSGKSRSLYNKDHAGLLFFLDVQATAFSPLEESFPIDLALAVLVFGENGPSLFLCCFNK